MPVWPRYPTLYEINTWVWLSELSLKTGRSVDLGSVPEAEWDAIARFGFDAVWFMGVWERSPAGIAIANQNENLLDDFRRALPDFKPEDNVGSPYCVRRYVVDAHLGGAEGLADCQARARETRHEAASGFRAQPCCAGSPVGHRAHRVLHSRDSATMPGTTRPPTLRYKEAFYACGRDPYFPPWPDVLQLNAFEPGLRQAVIETVSGIAAQCDGVRCDMAMLLLNQIFERTWGEPGRATATNRLLG